MIRSKTVAALAFVAAFGAGAASAADLAPWPYTKAAPVFVDPIYSWAGLYVGGHIGGSSTNQTWMNTARTAAFGDLNPGQGFNQSGTGVFGGGQVGYNWQASNFVFGLEGTISGMNNRGNLLNTAFGPTRNDQFSWRSNLMATVTGRAGFTVNNNLFYAKGGYAGIENRLAVADPFVGPGSATHWHNGWTVGAGWEYGITRNWSVGLEYDYSAFQMQTMNYQLAPAATGSYAFDAKPRDVQSAVVRFNYRFDGPLVARY